MKNLHIRKNPHRKKLTLREYENKMIFSVLPPSQLAQYLMMVQQALVNVGFILNLDFRSREVWCLNNIIHLHRRNVLFFVLLSSMVIPSSDWLFLQLKLFFLTSYLHSISYSSRAPNYGIILFIVFSVDNDRYCGDGGDDSVVDE